MSNNIIDDEYLYKQILNNCSKRIYSDMKLMKKVGSGGTIFSAFDEITKESVIIKFTNNIQKPDYPSEGGHIDSTEDELNELTYAEWMAAEGIGPEIIEGYFFSFYKNPDYVMICIIMEKGNLGSFGNMLENGIDYDLFDLLIVEITHLLEKQLDAGIVCHDIKPDNFIVSTSGPSRAGANPSDSTSTNNPPGYKVRMIDFDSKHCVKVKRVKKYDKTLIIGILLTQLYYMTGRTLVAPNKNRMPEMYSPEQIVIYMMSFWGKDYFPISTSKRSFGRPTNGRASPGEVYLERIADYINSMEDGNGIKSDFFWYVYKAKKGKRGYFEITPSMLMDVLMFTIGTKESTVWFELEEDSQALFVSKYLGKVMKEAYASVILGEEEHEPEPRYRGEKRKRSTGSPVWDMAILTLGRGSYVSQAAEAIAGSRDQEKATNNVQRYIGGLRGGSTSVIPPAIIDQRMVVSAPINNTAKRLSHYIAFTVADNNATTIQTVAHRSIVSRSPIISNNQLKICTTFAHSGPARKHRRIGTTSYSPFVDVKKCSNKIDYITQEPLAGYNKQDIIYIDTDDKLECFVREQLLDALDESSLIFVSPASRQAFGLFIFQAAIDAGYNKARFENGGDFNVDVKKFYNNVVSKDPDYLPYMMILNYIRLYRLPSHGTDLIGKDSIDNLKDTRFNKYKMHVVDYAKNVSSLDHTVHGEKILHFIRPIEEMSRGIEFPEPRLYNVDNSEWAFMSETNQKELTWVIKHESKEIRDRAGKYILKTEQIVLEDDSEFMDMD